MKRQPCRACRLHLLPGDFVTVIGSNGAGKSTLLNAISGSFFTDSGSIYLDGKRHHLPAGISALPAKSDVCSRIPIARQRPPHDH